MVSTSCSRAHWAKFLLFLFLKVISKSSCQNAGCSTGCLLIKSIYFASMLPSGDYYGDRSMCLRHPKRCKVQSKCFLPQISPFLRNWIKVGCVTEILIWLLRPWDYFVRLLCKQNIYILLRCTYLYQALANSLF